MSIQGKTPKLPQLSECKHDSFCRILKTISENYTRDTPPPVGDRAKINGSSRTGIFFKINYTVILFILILCMKVNTNVIVSETELYCSFRYFQVFRCMSFIRIV